MVQKYMGNPPLHHLKLTRSEKKGTPNSTSRIIAVLAQLQTFDPFARVRQMTYLGSPLNYLL